MVTNFGSSMGAMSECALCGLTGEMHMIFQAPDICSSCFLHKLKPAWHDTSAVWKDWGMYWLGRGRVGVVWSLTLGRI